MITELYADGGVIKRNPSPIGGTYAIRLIHDDGTIEQHSGLILPKQGYRGFVSNNVTKLAAVLCALGKVPDTWKGIVYSDSWVTLQRVFHHAKLENVPTWLIYKLQEELFRLGLPTHTIRPNQMEALKKRGITYVLLDGHPTKKQLDEGVGKRGNPVSEHNVWCDQECNRIGKVYLQSLQEEITV